MTKRDRNDADFRSGSQRSLNQFIECECENEALVTSVIEIFMMESLILAQDERWRRGLGMQVER